MILKPVSDVKKFVESGEKGSVIGITLFLTIMQGLWMMFLQSKNKEAFEMLAEKNEKIRKAYNILEIISKDDKARAAYAAREAELHDQNTRLKSAREEGLREGLKEAKKENAKNFLLMGLNVDMVTKGTGLSVEEVKKINKQLNFYFKKGAVNFDNSSFILLIFQFLFMIR